MAGRTPGGKRKAQDVDQAAGRLVQQLRDDPDNTDYQSQAKLAQAIGRSRQWLLLFEKGRAPLDLSALEALARAFGVDAGRLAAAIFRREQPTLKQLRARKPFPGVFSLRLDKMDSASRKQVLGAIELAQKIRSVTTPARRQLLEATVEEWWQTERETHGLGRRPGMKLVESKRKVHKGMRKLRGDPKFIEQVVAGKRPRRGRKK